MRGILAAALLAAAALLSGCDGTDDRALTDEAISLCPGGSHCPSGDYAGLVMADSAFSFTAAPETVSFAKAAIQPGAAAPLTAGETPVPPDARPTADPDPVRKMCPQKPGKGRCVPNESGLQWKAATNQIVCDGSECRRNNQVVQLKKGQDDWGKGYVAWLCVKGEPGCADLPQAP